MTNRRYSSPLDLQVKKIALLLLLAVLIGLLVNLTIDVTWATSSRDTTAMNNLGAAPYPPSPVISSLTWAPASTIMQAADNSDNFPLTWADDGHLYTAYGDGWGFEPYVPKKLSLGFARVTGPATNFIGINIPSPDQQTGQGETGKKASGMLMVEGVLYMWVRNANNNGEQCQLAWSTDHALTWTWSSWTFAEFGYCTFINFGQNYAGARDNYVYMVTHDNPNAYEAADRFILTRVPKNQVTNRNAYEFFRQLSGSSNPVWTPDIAQRGAVFTHIGAANRSGITYNAALGRYLWWQGIPHGGDERTSGGFGVYDAPEPWGPWTTVYFVDQWDVGPGETATFPTKWMSEDGKTLYLVFSGNDFFSVRRATLTVNASGPCDGSAAGVNTSIQPGQRSTLYKPISTSGSDIFIFLPLILKNWCIS